MDGLSGRRFPLGPWSHIVVLLQLCRRRTLRVVVGSLEVIGSGRCLHSNVSGLVFDGVCFGSKVLYP